MNTADIRQALAAFPDTLAVAGSFLEQWESGKRTIRTAKLHADIILGDARKSLPEWKSKADAWFLDGFSPAKNPELWGPYLMAEVAKHTVPSGTFATYSAAGHVRQNLTCAGFEVARIQGYGRKKHMTIGRLGSQE